jgi:hypothetical protein
LLPLGRGDIVALLDAEEVRDPRGGAASTATDFTPLAGARLSDQHEAIKGRLRPLRTERGVKVVSYSLEKQMI